MSQTFNPISSSNQNSNPKTNNSNISDQDLGQIQNLLFLDTLTSLITGFHLSELGQIQESITQKCLQVFVDYMINYLENKYGPKDAMRLKAISNFGDDSIFQKFTDLEDKFQEAFEAFVDQFAQSNNVQTI